MPTIANPANIPRIEGTMLAPAEIVVTEGARAPPEVTEDTELTALGTDVALGMPALPLAIAEIVESLELNFV